MPQPVMIQSEPMAAAGAKRHTVVEKDIETTAFSAQLNQQVIHSQAASESVASETSRAANRSEPEQDIAADGNNLPSGEQAIGGAEEQVAANSAQQGEDQDESGEKMLSTEKQSAEMQQQAGGITPAIHSQQMDNSSKTGEAEIKKSIRQTNTGDFVAKGATEKAITSDEEERQLARKATPNLATALKQAVEDEVDSPKIRADIKNALQHQQNKQDVVINPRSQLTGQVQQSEAKPLVTLPLTLSSGTTENGAPTLSAGGISSLLLSSGTGTALVSGQAALSLPVHPNMNNPVWAQVMSSRVVWMAKEGVQQASLRMNPATLGPVEVKLHVQNDQASVTFLAQQGATRDALEQALPRLRESFAENGIQLAHAEVGEHQHQQHERSEQAEDRHIFAQASPQDDDIDSEAVESVSSADISAGLSLYA